MNVDDETQELSDWFCERGYTTAEALGLLQTVMILLSIKGGYSPMEFQNGLTLSAKLYNSEWQFMMDSRELS